MIATASLVARPAGQATPRPLRMAVRAKPAPAGTERRPDLLPRPGSLGCPAWTHFPGAAQSRAQTPSHHLPDPTHARQIPHGESWPTPGKVVSVWLTCQVLVIGCLPIRKHRRRPMSVPLPERYSACRPARTSGGRWLAGPQGNVPRGWGKGAAVAVAAQRGNPFPRIGTGFPAGKWLDRCFSTPGESH